MKIIVVNFGGMAQTWAALPNAFDWNIKEFDEKFTGKVFCISFANYHDRQELIDALSSINIEFKYYLKDNDGNMITPALPHLSIYLSINQLDYIKRV